MDEEYDHDGGLAMYESRNKKGTREKQAQRQKAAQVADYRCANSGPLSPPFVSACGRRTFVRFAPFNRASS